MPLAEIREVAVEFCGGFAIGGVGFFFRVVIPKVYRSALVPNLRLPLLVPPIP